MHTLSTPSERGEFTPFFGVVYAVRTYGDPRIRYIGQTTFSAEARMRKHYQVARSGKRTPFYDWLRTLPDGAAYAYPIELVATSREALGEAEIRWIAQERPRDQLLNIAQGGMGPSGLVWTAEQREAARRRAMGRTGIKRLGELNPFYGRTHSAEQRAKWSESRTGTITGARNPNFGKFGAAHPAYGRKLSDETRERLSEQKRGPKNPNYGKKMSEEDRQRRSEKLKGRPMPSSRRSAHTRHHTNKGTFSESCPHCHDDLKNLKGHSDD